MKIFQIQIEKYTYRPPNQTVTNYHAFKERNKTHKEVIKQEERLFGKEDIRMMIECKKRSEF